jgi:thiol-disulfide isomerase/thioredoxin
MSTTLNTVGRGVAGTVRSALARVRLGMVRAKATLSTTPRVASEGKMPSLDGATAWLNSGPLTRADLRGKVVLVQFWNYSCIEWLRTFPYLSAWDDAYRPAGLVVIGVHTLEYSFEHDVDNVRRAVDGLGLKYPIAIDNHHAISDAFNNRYTPALYVVDAKRRIRRHYLGEQGYDEAEPLIRQLLESRSVSISPVPIRHFE